MNSHSSNAEESPREFVLPSKSMSVLEEQKKKALRERAKIAKNSIGGYDSSSDFSDIDDVGTGIESGDYQYEQGPDSCRSETSFTSRKSDFSRKSSYRRTPNVVATGHRSQSATYQSLDQSEPKELNRGARGDSGDISEQLINQQPIPSIDSIDAGGKRLSYPSNSRCFFSRELDSSDNEKHLGSSRSQSKAFNSSIAENVNTPKSFAFSCRSTSKVISRSSSKSSKRDSKIVNKNQIDGGNTNTETTKNQILKKVNERMGLAYSLPGSLDLDNTYYTSDESLAYISGPGVECDLEIDQKTNHIELENGYSEDTITEENSNHNEPEQGDADSDDADTEENCNHNEPEQEDSDDTVTEKNSTLYALKATNPSGTSLYPSLHEFSSELDNKVNSTNCDEKSESSEDGAQIRPQIAMSQSAFCLQYPSKSDYGLSSTVSQMKIIKKLFHGKSIENSQKVDRLSYDTILGLFLTEETHIMDDERKSIVESFLKEKSMLTDKFYNMQQNENEIQYTLVPNRIIENLEEFVLLPVPPGFVMKCRIIRDRKGLGKSVFPCYYLQMERDDGRKTLLMVSHKKKKSTTSYYAITTDPSNTSTESDSYTGKLRSNMLGTNFTVYDSHLSSKQFKSLERMNAKEPISWQCREELAMVFYETNVLGFKGPRKMEIVIPKMLSHAARVENRPEQKSLTMLEKIKKNDMQNLHCLKNKTPVWNQDNQSYVLNFHGRVTHASVKNFKLVTKDTDGYCALQFGRIAEDVFNLDFGYPICPLQAFAIVLSSFDSKLACE